MSDVSAKKLLPNQALAVLMHDVKSFESAFYSNPHIGGEAREWMDEWAGRLEASVRRLRISVLEEAAGQEDQNE